MGFNIVLIEPEIPTNTGNIGRLSLASGSTLHLVKPFGFELNDSRLKRAGLDYWKHVPVHIYENSKEFFSVNAGRHFAYFSSHGKQDYCAVDYQGDPFLVFGKESTGLPQSLVAEHPDHVFSIPIHSPHVRSLNLANAVSVVVYEGLRSIRPAMEQSTSASSV